LAAILANQNRKRGAPAVKPADFFPSLKVPHRKMTIDEMRARVIKHFGINARR
jgi:hypothetical protein